MGLILSGVQPTGNLHLGNYLGAIRNWVKLQHEHECFFMLADLHAITVHQEPKDLQDAVYKVTALYIAAGIDPEKAVIFNQSRVSAHAELGWILGCNTPLGWLNRMTQFKDKAGKDKEKAPLGLYSYPVLMAADILAYNATHVPVGDDQRQHLELARDIAAAFNRNYGVEFFKIPEALIMGAATRVMSLRDGTKKMSKSDPSDFSRINLGDTAEQIAEKLKKAKSDMVEGISYEPQTRPEVANLLNIYGALYDEKPEDAAMKFASHNFSKFKSEMAEAITAKISPISQRYNELVADKGYILEVLKKGAERANAVAQPNLAKTKEIVGFI